MPNIIVRKEEKKRKERYRFAEELVNFILILIGFAVAIIAAILLVQLIRWGYAKFLSELKPILNMIWDAVIFPD